MNEQIFIKQTIVPYFNSKLFIFVDQYIDLRKKLDNIFMKEKIGSV